MFKGDITKGMITGFIAYALIDLSGDFLGVNYIVKVISFALLIVLIALLLNKK